MKRVLYFYPHKFSKLTDGCHVRVVSFLNYFKSRDILVDMLSYENSSISEDYLTINSLVNSLTFVDENPFENKGAEKGELFIKKKLRSLLKVRKDNDGQKLPNFASDGLIKKVRDLLAKCHYDFFLVTYTYWADLAMHLISGHGTRSILDTNDFLTLQLYYKDGSFKNVGSMFSDELTRANKFDEIIHISYDEKVLFSNFIHEDKNYFIPQFFESNKHEFGNLNKRFDIIFVGGKNQFNIEGINWFLEKVLPFIRKDARIAIAGNICDIIDKQYDRVIKLGFVEDIKDLYASSKCCICPIKKGSGMKIKVIEALSFGLPVVSTTKGVDGFVNKDFEGGMIVEDQAEIFAEQLNRLLTDKEFYKNQCQLSLNLFEKYFSAEINYSKLDKVFDFKATKSKL